MVGRQLLTVYSSAAKGEKPVCQQSSKLRETQVCNADMSVFSTTPTNYFLPLSSSNVVSARDFSEASLDLVDLSRERLVHPCLCLCWCILACASLPGSSPGIPRTAHALSSGSLALEKQCPESRDGGGGAAAGHCELRNRWSISVSLPPDRREPATVPLPGHMADKPRF